MASSHGSLLPIEKLEGMANYNNWKFAMQMYLIHEDLWEYVSTEVQGPDPKKDDRAKAKMCLMVQPSGYSYVRNASSAKVAWDNLAKAFEDKGLSRRLSLLRNLFSITLSNFSNMEENVSEVMSLTQKLNDINASLEDEFVGVILLNGLPAEYNPMVMALENSNQKISSVLERAVRVQRPRSQHLPLRRPQRRRGRPVPIPLLHPGHRGPSAPVRQAALERGQPGPSHLPGVRGGAARRQGAAQHALRL
ncbi:unnamed protein product [Phaedon cochleariae]|uniref:DUF4219 domain-containing protein n=1 Tax=Phaedon cochleariae TaxID=80249 RepID=A0A9N9X2I9_PHACE|nr:unnamed protein product [Phaedon cochleariae]